jgi:putative transposase
MPWRETSPMDQRLQFIADYTRDLWTMSELCAQYGISRKTGYKWLTRYALLGPAGLEQRSRRPHRCPHATPAPVVSALLKARRGHPDWSAKKLLAILAPRHPPWRLPAVSTAQAILKRHGLVRHQRRRPRRGHPGRPTTVSTAPNDVWTADFKGEFKTRDGRYCYPLTVIDHYSRCVLACRALLGPTYAGTRASFQQLFRTYGLPRVIRTDNGTPFAGTGLARLSRLAVWWIRLGIEPELIEPAHPEQNGRHERFHRTLKGRTTRPPAASRAGQQRRFTTFCREFNHVRPHEALGQTAPAQHYAPSPRRLPQQLAPLSYPAHFEQRRVGSNGCIRWHTHFVFVSSVLAGECLGLEERATDRWAVYLGPHYLGLLNQDLLTIEDRYAPSTP